MGTCQQAAETVVHNCSRSPNLTALTRNHRSGVISRELSQVVYGGSKRKSWAGVYFKEASGNPRSLARGALSPHLLKGNASGDLRGQWECVAEHRWKVRLVNVNDP